MRTRVKDKRVLALVKAFLKAEALTGERFAGGTQDPDFGLLLPCGGVCGRLGHPRPFHDEAGIWQRDRNLYTT